MRSRGFTLIDLMITVAILTVLAGIAIPIYNGYIREARLGVARNNMESLRIYLEDFRLDNGSYMAGGGSSFNKAALDTNFGWTPDGDGNGFLYTVTANTNSFDVLVEWAADTSQWAFCEQRMSLCCDNDTSGASKTSCD